MPYLKPISCTLLAIGLGWTFAEVRRFFFHTGDFIREASNDLFHRRVISLLCGVLFLFSGFLAAGFAFGLWSPAFAWERLIDLKSEETRHFLTVFGIGFGGWVIFSATSTRFLPPPLFSERATTVLCRIVRGGLLVVWGAAIYFTYPKIGDHWKADAFGALLALLALGAIHSGQLLWNNGGWMDWEVPPITCTDRPFPYVAAVLLMIALATLCFVADEKTDAKSSGNDGHPTPHVQPTASSPSAGQSISPSRRVG